MLRSVTICICRREGGMCGNPGWQYTRMTAPLARDQNEMCKHTMCGCSPHEPVIHRSGAGASVESFLSITVTGLAINIRRQNLPQRKTLHRHAAGHSIQR